MLILTIFCGEESVISVFQFLRKAIVSVYYSIYLPFLLSRKIFFLSCSLRFIKFLIFCTLRFIILFLRFLFYVPVSYLLTVFLASNMSRFSCVFNVNVMCLASDDFNDVRSFLIFSNNSVHVDVHVNVDNYLNCNIYD